MTERQRNELAARLSGELVPDRYALA
jgi:hypothetical protein